MEEQKMKSRKRSCGHPGEGRLPECAPLANPYVPFQPNEPPKYEARRGMVRGTLFPGLDLPFMGMSNEVEKSDTPLHDLQALAFAIQELALYLDTHSDDQEALELYRAYQDLYRRGAESYIQKYGPLNHMNSMEDGAYRWLDSPWPWDYRPEQERPEQPEQPEEPERPGMRR